GAAAPEAGPQTGDGGGVSYAGLVLDLDRPHRCEQLLDEVVLLVVQRGTAEAGDAHRAPDTVALVVEFLPGLAAGLQHAVDDHLHGRVEIEVFPFGAVGPAVADPGLAQLAGDEVF